MFKQERERRDCQMSEIRERKQKVVLSNDAARNANFDLTMQQLKILLYAISKIKPGDDPGTWYEIDLLEMGRCCGIQVGKSGAYYTRIKKDFMYLMSRHWEPLQASDEPNHNAATSWLGDADIKENSGVIRYRFNPYIAEYLFNLRQNYTMFELEQILTFTCKYSIRIYIFLKSYMNLDTPVEFKRETLQLKFSPAAKKKNIINTIEEEPTPDESAKLIDDWRNFRRKILEAPIEEINEKSDDMHIAVEYIKANRSHSVTHVRFILTKPGINQRNSAREAREQALK